MIMEEVLKIKRLCAVFFRVDQFYFDQNTRKKEVVGKRQLVHAMCKRFTKASLATIGSWVGGRDHATVLHSIKTVNNHCDTEKDYAQTYNDLIKYILTRLSNPDYILETASNNIDVLISLLGDIKKINGLAVTINKLQEIKAELIKTRETYEQDSILSRDQQAGVEVHPCNEP